VSYIHRDQADNHDTDELLATLTRDRVDYWSYHEEASYFVTDVAVAPFHHHLQSKPTEWYYNQYQSLFQKRKMAGMNPHSNWLMTMVNIKQQVLVKRLGYIHSKSESLSITSFTRIRCRAHIPFCVADWSSQAIAYYSWVLLRSEKQCSYPIYAPAIYL